MCTGKAIPCSHTASFCPTLRVYNKVNINSFATSAQPAPTLSIFNNLRIVKRRETLGSLAVCLLLSYVSTGRNVAAHGRDRNQGNSGSERKSRLSSQWDCLSERSINKGRLKPPLFYLLTSKSPGTSPKCKMQLAAGFPASK